MSKQGKPNILILKGDDIGWWNIAHPIEQIIEAYVK
jgi:hypothetical protein